MSDKLQFVAASLTIHNWFESLRLNASGFAYDALEELGYCAPIERAGVGLLQSLEHRLLAFRIAERQSGSSLESANLHCEPGSPVQKFEQLPVHFVYFRAPVFDIHGG